MRSCFAQSVRFLCLGLFLVGIAPSIARAEIPKPSIYPISWELKFESVTPKRIAVTVPTSDTPQAFWYLTYVVTNHTDKEQTFFPKFDLVTNDGQLIRSDAAIPSTVFDAIKTREKKSFLEPAALLAGKIKLGEAEARDGVAIWPEVLPRMGKFNIFVEGLCGEFTTIKEADKEIILRKTLQLNFFIRGDEVYPGEDEVNRDVSAWIMR